MRQRQTGQADKLGIYIHIPFCRSKCDYCDFYSLAGREDRMDAYQKALLAHIRETAPLAQGIPVDTIYFGGGTPSWYGARRIQELLSALSKLFRWRRTQRSRWRQTLTAWTCVPCAACGRRGSTACPWGCSPAAPRSWSPSTAPTPSDRWTRRWRPPGRPS